MAPKAKTPARGRSQPRAKTPSKSRASSPGGEAARAPSRGRSRPRAAAAAPDPAAAGGRRRALVTGGAGFLGQNLVRMLVESGKYDVTVFDIRPFPDPSVDCVSIRGDLLSFDTVKAAVGAHDVVFHAATLAVTGKNATTRGPMYQVNVVGTENVVRACRETACKNLVYTSSASVAWDGTDFNFVDEDRPYPARYMDFYTETKMLGEKTVLEADGADGVRAVALRPSGIFGENDLLTAPTTVKQCRRGKMRFVIGDGKNVLDWTYVGNVSHAHLLAADALFAGDPAVRGRPYFVTNDDPRPFWTFLSMLLEGFGYPEHMRPHKHLPAGPIIAVAWVVELVIKLLRLFGVHLQTDFTVFRMLVATKHRHFSCEAAKRDLGYRPLVSVEEGLRRMHASMPHLARDAMDAAEGAGRGAGAATPRRPSSPGGRVPERDFSPIATRSARKRRNAPARA